MFPLKLQKTSGGQKNVTYHVRGFVHGRDMEKTEFKIEHPEASELKFSSALWIIQEKLTLYLWWAKDDLLLPMESRNSIRFDLAVKPPIGWNGTMCLSSLNWNAPNAIGKAFYLVLDFDR